MKFQLSKEEKEIIQEGIIEPTKFVFSSWNNFFETLMIGITLVLWFFLIMAIA